MLAGAAGAFFIAAGCATAASAGDGDAPGLPSASPSSALPPPAAAPSRGPLNHDLGGPDGVARLCEALRDEDGIRFEGNEVARAKAREDHERQRAGLADRTYVVRVPAQGFGFRGYDLAGQRLALDTSRSFSVGDNVELVTNEPSSSARLAFTLPPDAADRALKSHASRRLVLRLVFRPLRSDLRRDGCVRMSGGRVVKLPVEVLAYTLVGDGGAAVARGQTADYVDESAVSEPEVSVGRPRSNEGREVPDAVADAARALGTTLLPCYQKALERRPSLRGTLVLDVRVLPDGRIEAPRMQVSSLGDETLVACAVSRTGKAKLPGGGGHLTLPVSFGGKEDR
jgi:hypothetical protein